MTLALVRHGRTPWNLERRLQGRSDISLDELGVGQADAAGRLLGRWNWDRVVSSPLNRARESAAIIAGRLPGLAVAQDVRLLERDFGEAEGMLLSEAAERWPSGDYPHAEPLDALAVRAGYALGELLDGPGTAVVVSHGVFLRAGIERLTGEACPRILNGQVVLLSLGAGRQVTAQFLS